MAAGSLLVQPQRLRRAADADPAMSLLDDLRALFAVVVADSVQEGPILDLAAGAVEATATNLLSGILDDLGNIADAFSEASGSDDVLEAARQILLRLADTAADLSPQALREPIDELIDIVETDLRLTPDFLESEVLALFDRIIASLEDVPAEATDQSRHNRVEAALILRRIRAHLEGELEIPELNPGRLAEELWEFLRRYGAETITARVRCVGDAVGQGVRVAGGLTQLVPFTGAGARSVGAAAAAASLDEYCWYATWLLGKKRPWYFSLIPTLPDDQVWVDRGAQQIMNKRVFRDDQILATATSNWADAIIFDPERPVSELTPFGIESHYTFKHATPETLEQVAYISAIVVNGLEMIAHLISLEEGDYASNAWNAMFNFTFGLAKILHKQPLPWWFETLVCRMLGTIITSFEGMHTKVSAYNWFMMWLTLVGPDLGEVVAYNSAFNGLRDLLLSFMTLLNYEQPANPATERRPQNRLELDGVADPFVSLFGKFLMLIIPKEDYCHPFQSGDQALKMLVFWQLFGSTIFGLIGGFVGSLVALKIVAQTDDFEGLPAKMGRSAISGWLSFWPSLYFDKEGNTSDGTYNPNGPADFTGYPPADSSPYRLPYPAGVSYYVGQGNQGLWSHSFINNSQIYAYDFSMDQADAIVASRAGTVVDFFDWCPDDDDVTTNLPSGVTAGPGQTTQTRWNFILIRHDVDDDGNAITPDPVHDLGPGGTPTFTYAVYGHGRQNSIMPIFATKLGIAPGSITPSNILNATNPVTVRRGEPIMLAGDTGISFHNHLHMMVRPELGAGGNVRGMTENTNLGIPFVFREVRNFIGPDGVCLRFNFYTSENS
jgi:hypothetical protein